MTKRVKRVSMITTPMFKPNPIEMKFIREFHDEKEKIEKEIFASLGIPKSITEASRSFKGCSLRLLDPGTWSLVLIAKQIHQLQGAIPVEVCRRIERQRQAAGVNGLWHVLPRIVRVTREVPSAIRISYLSKSKEAATPSSQASSKYLIREILVVVLGNEIRLSCG